MVRVPKPSRDDPDPSTKLPKTIKPLLSHLSTSLERLDQESKLIQRLWYKGRSQFRSAVWWRSFDGVRRSTKKLSASPQTTTDDPRDLDLPIPSLGHLALSSARKSYSSLWVEIGGGGDKSIGTSFHASKSSQPRKQQKESKGIAEPTSSSSSSSRTVFVFSPPTKSLERCDEERRATALNECLANFRSTLNLLSELHRSLIGLRARCRYAWYILSCHLRTPPAPTFAPQAVALLGVCSNLDQICSDLLYGRRDSNGGPSSSLSREGTHGGGDRETEGPPGSGLDRLYSVLYLTMSEFEVREEGDSQGEAASVDFDGDEARTRSLPLGDGGEGKMDPQDGRERKGKGKRKASPEGMGSGDGLESRKRKRLDTSDGDERKKGEEGKETKRKGNRPSKAKRRRRRRREKEQRPKGNPFEPPPSNLEGKERRKSRIWTMGLPLPDRITRSQDPFESQGSWKRDGEKVAPPPPVLNPSFQPSPPKSDQVGKTWVGFQEDLDQDLDLGVAISR